MKSSYGTGADQVIAGFIVGGGPKRMLTRGIGPTLANQGVPGVLTDPIITLYDGSAVSATNDNWRVANEVVGISWTGRAPPDDREAALLVTLQSGSYTVILGGVGGSTGVGLI
jgi:hypothetical protein